MPLNGVGRVREVSFCIIERVDNLPLKLPETSAHRARTLMPRQNHATTSISIRLSEKSQIRPRFARAGAEIQPARKIPAFSPYMPQAIAGGHSEHPHHWHRKRLPRASDYLSGDWGHNT
jgi:hypothetical protein